MRCQGSLPVTHQQRELGLSNAYVTNQYKTKLYEKFDILLLKRKTDVNAIVDLLKTTRLSTILSDELLLIISEFTYPEQNYNLYLIFQRKKFFHKDTYYMFVGTKPRLERSLKRLKEEGQATEDNELADIPFDQPLRWTLFTFELKSQYDKCVDNIVINGHRASASGLVKLCDISKVDTN
jgi:hypothetical protein